MKVQTERVWMVGLTFLAVVAAFTAVWLQHRDAKELVRVQVALEMVKMFDSSDMRRARRALAKELLKKHPEAGLSETRVLDFFETVSGLLDQEKWPHSLRQSERVS